MKSDEKKEIVIIGFPYTNRTDTGRGIDRYLATLYETFLNHGINLTLIDEGVVRPKLIEVIINSMKVLIKLRKTKADVYHAVDPLGTLIAILALKKNIITTIHDTIPLDGEVSMFGWPWFIAMKLSMIISLIVSAEIIVPFNSTKEKLVKKFGVPERLIRVVNYALNLKVGDSEISNNYLHSEDKIINLLFIGGGSPIDRGLEIVLDTLDDIKEVLPNIHLTIVSKFKTFDSHGERIVSYVKSGKVKLLDYIPESEIQIFISQFYAFIYPSSLGFSYLVMQAMSAGVPVITSNVRDMKDYLGTSGILCDQADVGCYTRALIELLDEEKRRIVVLNQFKRLKDFSTENFFNEMNRVYTNSTDIDRK